jgi:type I restriction-modification system DNA methylase subunit
MALFQNSVLKKYQATQDQPQIEEAFLQFQRYFGNPLIRENIRNSKEEQFQEGFLRELFVKILGYTINPEPDFNLTTELKNIKDAKKTDGAILLPSPEGEGSGVRSALAVIELKGTDTKDLEKIRDQAFNYKNNQPECIYVITSNFEKLRFYIHNAVEHQEFNLFQLTRPEFELLWLLLQKDNLLDGMPAKIKEESLQAQEQVTKKLYADYSAFKQELWQDMVAQNLGEDELTLYKKSQKLLDRFLFIFFAEDKGLLPPNSINEIITQWDKLTELDEYRPLFDRFKKYFGYLNTGRVQAGKPEIHAYNGGLFASDTLLDSVKISDALLKKHCRKLSEYDFDTEVDTNILGHIFEHSLNDIENVRASLEGTEIDKSKTKRKKDGVFYTPKYITKYIVDNTLGRLCAEKKIELNIVDEDFAEGKRGRQKKTIQQLKAKLDAYRAWLLQLTICDPACGSGAFLNQVLEYLIAEHRYLDELESQLFGTPMVLPNVENQILENNIFGVDINEESVEIARLSLWLRTAKKGRKLSSLSSNIKVGNSLIDDPAVAGDLAFNWETEFPQVFAKGGFDVVVGNPPYVDIKGMEKNIVDYLFKAYKTSNNRVNLYSTFVERTTDLIKFQGIFSFIIPSSILTSSSYMGLRIELLKKVKIDNIVRLPNESFGGSAGEVKVDTIIITFSKNDIQTETDVIIYKGFDRISEISQFNCDIYYKINQTIWNDNDEYIFKINSNPRIEKLIEKIETNSANLIDCSEFCLGLTPYDKYKGHSQEQIKNREFHSTYKKDDSFKMLLAGNDIRRYIVEWGGEEWISYGSWLGASRDEKFFKEKRILVKQIIDWSDKRIWAAMTTEEIYNTQNAFNIIPNEDFSCEFLLVSSE